MAKFKPFQFDPIKDLDIEIPRNKKKEALEAVAKLLDTTILEYASEGRSPVKGGRWVKKLEKDYEAKKGKGSFADLLDSGHLLENLSVEVSGSKIVIDVDEEDEGKAEGHLTGVYGDNSKKVKPRQFMPQKGQEFRSGIMADVKRILKEFEDGES